MVIHKNIDEIKDLIAKEKMILLYISSEGCNVCKVIFPRVEEMLKQYPNIMSVRTSLEEQPELSGSFNVFTIPCILVYAEGREIIREARYINLQGMEEQIERYYNMIF